MWLKIQNELINLNSVSNFTFDNSILQLKITFISGEKKIFDYSTWPEFNSTKNSINEIVDKYMAKVDENREALEEKWKIQEMFETLQRLYPIKEDSMTNNDILNGRGLKKMLDKNGNLFPKDY